MKLIIMYSYEDESVILKEQEDNKIIMSKEMKNEPYREFMMSYYNRLGSTFEERWNTIKEHEKDRVKRKQPFFWDNPGLKLVCKEE